MIIQTSFARMELLEDKENEIIILPESYHIEFLYICPAYRGKKIGKILVALAKYLAQTSGKKHLTLYASAFDNEGVDQEDLVKWYELQGFYIVNGYNMAMDL